MGQIRYVWFVLCIYLWGLPVLLTPLTAAAEKRLSSSSKLQFGMVVDRGGIDDQAFNTSAYRGLKKAEKELGVSIKVVEATDDNASEPLLRRLARKKFDLIFAVGVAHEDALKKVATEFPDRSFVYIDAKLDLPNVRSIVFDEHEGAFLVGALAALFSKTQKIGFIGGMEIPVMRRFALGYEAGMKQVHSKKVKLIENYIGVTTQAWNDPAKAKELARSQYDRGVDVIFVAAGASGFGVFEAAEERKRFAIGVDTNQNHLKPGRILTSMLKQLDVAVYQTCSERVKQGHIDFGVRSYGLKNDGVGFSLDEYNKPLLSQEILDEVDLLKRQVTLGKIKVPDYYKMQSKITLTTSR